MSTRHIQDDETKVFVKWLVDDNFKCGFIDLWLKFVLMIAFALPFVVFSDFLQSYIMERLISIPFPLLGYLLGRYLSRRHFNKFRWLAIRKENWKTKLSMRTFVPKVTIVRYKDKEVEVARTETFDHKFKVFSVFGGEGKVPPDYQPTTIIEPSTMTILLGFDNLGEQASKQRLMELFLSSLPEDTGTIVSDLFKNKPRHWDKITAIGTMILVLLTLILVIIAISK